MSFDEIDRGEGALRVTGEILQQLGIDATLQWATAPAARTHDVVHTANRAGSEVASHRPDPLRR